MFLKTTIQVQEWCHFVELVELYNICHKANFVQCSYGDSVKLLFYVLWIVRCHSRVFFKADDPVLSIV